MCWVGGCACACVCVCVCVRPGSFVSKFNIAVLTAAVSRSVGITSDLPMLVVVIRKSWSAVVQAVQNKGCRH
jgi:hypothetical protein